MAKRQLRRRRSRKPVHVPNTGDLGFLSPRPAGRRGGPGPSCHREPAMFRAAFVLCPVTNQTKGYPFEGFAGRTLIQGVAP
jgi:hypothetical protein